LALAQAAPPPAAAPAAPAPAAAPAAPAAPAAAPAAPAAPPAPKWYESAKIEAFVDAYSSWNFNFPKPAVSNTGRAFDAYNGFALHWAGVNASFAPDPTKGSPVGGFVGLRFGPGAALYSLAPDMAIGAGNVKEAYVSYKPDPKFQIDIGKFSTWIGAEVADSQYNMNYTRSALFFTQPAWHTGIRIDLPLADQFDLKLLAVNGWNSSIDNNTGKSFGAVLNFIPSSTMSFYINYIGGPEQPDTVTTTDAMGMMTTKVDTDAGGRWRHLVDAIADMHFDKAHLLINADFGTEKLDAAGDKNTWYGANATLGYQMSDMFGFAVRGGYTADSDGTAIEAGWGGPATCGTPPAPCKAKVIDATLTLAATPTPNLIIKLEPRIDSFSNDNSDFKLYPKGDSGDASKTLFTAVLGAVVTTN
jgi:hypothetical protein